MPLALQPSFAAGELAPSLHARIDLAKYSVGLALCRNFFVRIHGGVSNRPGFEFIVEAKDTGHPEVRLAPFEYSTIQTYMLLFGHEYIWVLKDGGVVLETDQSVASVTTGSTTTITLSGSHGWNNGDTVYLIGIGGTVGDILNGRFLKISAASGASFQVSVDTTGLSYSSGGKAARVYEISTPYQAQHLRELKFTQSNDVMTITHHSYPVMELSRTGHTSWTLGAVSFVITMPGPSSVTVTPSGLTAGANTLQYAVTAVDEETGEESEATESTAMTYDTWAAGAVVDLSWPAVTGASKYNVYRKRGGVYGFIGVADGTTFQDNNILPDLLDNPPVGRDPFSSSNYPAVPSYYEQRAVFGNTVDDNQRLELSVAGQFHNFSTTPSVKATDAISLSLASRRAEAIRSIVPLDWMLVFTSGGVWKVGTGSDQGLATTTIQAKKQVDQGVARYIEPIVIGSTVLYVQSSEDLVRTIGYKLERDGYAGNNLSVMATHLTVDAEKSFVSWAYAEAPDSIVWGVLDDGSMAALTFVEEHDIWAWHRHDTKGGQFRDVATVREGNADALYAAVERTIGGTTRIYIERLHDRKFVNDQADAFFVDSGLTYSGPAVTEITGIHHLAGESVAVLADANVVDGVTVSSDGKVTLPVAASKVHVGLPITADVQTLPLDVKGSPQTLQGRKKTVASVTLRVQDSRGFWAGPDEDNLVEYAQRDHEDYGDPVSLKTGIARVVIKNDWNDDGQVFIRQTDPLPMTILAAIPDVQVGG